MRADLPDTQAGPARRGAALRRGTPLKNPFDDGGLLDRAMPYIGLAASTYLLIQGLRLYISGSTILWTLAAGAVFLTACFDIFRSLRKQRLTRRPQ